MILAVDIGNRFIKLAAFDRSDWSASQRFPTELVQNADAFGTVISEAFPHLSPDKIGIASVTPQADGPASDVLFARFGSTPLFLDSANARIEVRYDPPESLGADRLANALAVLRLVGSPSIAVDCGTAITLDVISADGAFVGGAILPGVTTSFDALAAHGAKLPRAAADAPLRTIGDDTMSSIRIGVIAGLAGAIDALVGRFRAEVGLTAPVVATGGDAELLRRESRTMAHVNEMLTMEGIRFFLEAL